MEQLLRAKIQKVVNGIIRRDSNVARELMEDYKDRLVDSVCDIFAALADLYDDEDQMKKRVEEFVKENLEISTDEIKGKKGYHTDGYMVASVPVLVPIEAIAIVDDMDDLTLPLILSQLSGWLLKTIVELREYSNISDKLLEKHGAKLAETLKDKGWVA